MIGKVTTIERDDMAEHFVKFDFGLSWSQVAKGLTFMVGGIAALAAAGWLNMPASQGALDKVTVQLIETSKQVAELQAVVKELTQAVGSLNNAMTRPPVSHARKVAR